MKELRRLSGEILYLCLAVPMYYFTNEDIIIGGFGFMYRYLFAIGIILMAGLAFLTVPKLERLVVSLRYGAVFAAPYFWCLLYSLFLWLILLMPFRVMTRGFFFVVYQIIAIFTAASVLYMFGRRGMYLQLLALFTANGIHIFNSIRDNGFNEFVSQYVDVVVSFAGNTGPVMKEFELLGYSYSLGFFLVYFFLDIEESKKKKVWIAVAMVLFLMGLKRSVFLAMLVAIAMGWLLKLFFRERSRGFLMVICAMAVIFGFVYVAAVNQGLFHWLEEIGINTNDRAWLFDQFKDYYALEPGYMGKGAGYVSGSISIGDIILDHDGYMFGDIHNEFLRQYIELGFCGFFIWMLIFLPYRLHFFFHRLKTQIDWQHGVLAAAFILTTYITFMTENSYYHFYTVLSISTLIMAYQYEYYTELEKEQRYKADDI